MSKYDKSITAGRSTEIKDLDNIESWKILTKKFQSSQPSNTQSFLDDLNILLNSSSTEKQKADAFRILVDELLKDLGTNTKPRYDLLFKIAENTQKISSTLAKVVMTKLADKMLGEMFTNPAFRRCLLDMVKYLRTKPDDPLGPNPNSTPQISLPELAKKIGEEFSSNILKHLEAKDFIDAKFQAELLKTYKSLFNAQNYLSTLKLLAEKLGNSDAQLLLVKLYSSPQGIYPPNLPKETRTAQAEYYAEMAANNGKEDGGRFFLESGNALIRIGDRRGGQEKIVKAAHFGNIEAYGILITYARGLVEKKDPKYKKEISSLCDEIIFIKAVKPEFNLSKISQKQLDALILHQKETEMKMVPFMGNSLQPHKVMSSSSLISIGQADSWQLDGSWTTDFSQITNTINAQIVSAFNVFSSSKNENRKKKIFSLMVTALDDILEMVDKKPEEDRNGFLSKNHPSFNFYYEQLGLKTRVYSNGNVKDRASRSDLINFTMPQGLASPINKIPEVQEAQKYLFAEIYISPIFKYSNFDSISGLLEKIPAKIKDQGKSLLTVAMETGNTLLLLALADKVPSWGKDELDNASQIFKNICIRKAKAEADLCFDKGYFELLTPSQEDSTKDIYYNIRLLFDLDGLLKTASPQLKKEIQAKRANLIEGITSERNYNNPLMEQNIARNEKSKIIAEEIVIESCKVLKSHINKPKRIEYSIDEINRFLRNRDIINLEFLISDQDARKKFVETAAKVMTGEIKFPEQGAALSVFQGSIVGITKSIKNCRDGHQIKTDDVQKGGWRAICKRSIENTVKTLKLEMPQIVPKKQQKAPGGPPNGDMDPPSMSLNNSKSTQRKPGQDSLNR